MSDIVVLSTGHIINLDNIAGLDPWSPSNGGQLCIRHVGGQAQNIFRVPESDYADIVNHFCPQSPFAMVAEGSDAVAPEVEEQVEKPKRKSRKRSKPDPEILAIKHRMKDAGIRGWKTMKPDACREWAAEQDKAA